MVGPGNALLLPYTGDVLTGFEETLRVAGAAQEIARQSKDHREEVRAFVDKPYFKGR